MKVGSAGSVGPGSVSPGSISPGSVGPGSVGPGSVIAGRFQLIAQVAVGGMGTVHRAMDLTRKRAVAVKLLTEIDSTEATNRFRREAEILADLRHPGIVEFVDAGPLEDGGMYLAMQWLEGLDLAHRLLSGPLSCAEAVTLARRVAEALSAAHARGVLHRDVKPQNVFLREGDVTRPVLLDFGIASLVGLMNGITRTGLTIGTPGFMAPEQARGERTLDPRVDVYGLGCLMFQCITGSPPFVGPSAVAIVAEVLLSTAPRLRSRAPDVPADLDNLVASMLAKETAQRPRDGHAVAQSLRDIEATFGLPASVRPATVSGEERRMTAVVAVAQPTDTPASSPKGTIPMRGTFLPKLTALHRGDLRSTAAGVIHVVFTSDESVLDAASRAGSLALETVKADPSLRVSVAVGPSQFGGGLDAALVERLHQLATTPGAVMADANARAMLLADFAFSQSEHGYRLLSARILDEPTRTSPFVGRDRELRSLLDTFEAVTEESTPRAALVVGPAGMGKSRLLRELYGSLEQREPIPAVIDARAEPIRKDTALSLLGQLVRRGLAVVDGAAPEEQAALLRSALEPLVSAEQVPRIAAFLSIAADIREPLGATMAEVAAARRDPQLLEDQIGRAFGAVVSGLAAKSGSVAIMIDDAQSMDIVSARILGRALRRRQDSPIALFAFARPDVDERLTLSLREVSLERVQLGGLPRHAAEKLVRSALADRATDELVQRIVLQGEGSPLFLRELSQFAVEQRHETIPSGVLASLESRLLRLAPITRKILRAASVFGETFWQGGVVALLGEGSAEARSLSDWLVFLVEHDVISVRRTTRFLGEAELSFRHALMRDVAYTMLTPEDRTRGHRLAAAWLERVGEREPRVLAAHFDAANDPAAATHWARAGRLAYERNDAQQAIECVERALRQGLAGRERAEALVLLTNALAWTGQIDRAVQRATEAVASSPPGSQGWVEATSALIRVHSRRDEGTVVDMLRRLVEAVRRDSTLKPVPETLSLLIPVALRRGQPQLAADVIGVLGEAALAHSPRDPGVRASILRCRSWQALFQWDYAACVAFDREALACFRATGDRRQACQSHFDVGFDLMMLADYERAEQTFTEVLAEARGLAIESLEHLVEHNLSFALHRLGKTTEARALQRKCIELAAQRNDRVGEAQARHYLSIIHYDAGDLRAAELEAERSLTVAEALSLRWDTLARLGLIALKSGNRPLARLRINEALRGLVEHDNAEEGDMTIRLAGIELAFLEGDEAGARAQLEVAKAKLMAAIARIPDDEHKNMFLSRIPEHRRLLELANRV